MIIVLRLFLVCNQSLEIQNDNGMAAMLDDKTKRSVIQHGCHTIVFWISRDWLQTKNNECCLSIRFVLVEVYCGRSLHVNLSFHRVTTVQTLFLISDNLKIKSNNESQRNGKLKKMQHIPNVFSLASN